MKKLIKKFNDSSPIISILVQSVIYSILVIFYLHFVSAASLVLQIILGVFVISVIFGIIIFVYKPFRILNLKSFYSFDFVLSSLLLTFLFSAIFAIPECMIIQNESWWYFGIISTLLLIVLGIIIFRFLSISLEVRSNDFTLIDVFNNKLPDKMSELRIEDKPIDTDLLSRNDVIKRIRNAIYEYGGINSQLVSITGKWGCGKTTALNLSLTDINKHKDLIISRFDPWGYEDFRSTFVALYKQIISDLNLGSISDSVIQGIESLANEFLEDVNLGSLSSFLFLSSKTINIKEIIQNYLMANGKRLIVVIDNADRITYKNFVFLINTIEDLCKLKKITIVCLYDNMIVKSYLDKAALDRDYLDKIVSVEIKIDNPLKTDIVEIGKKVLNNIFAKYLPKEKLFSSEFSGLIDDLLKSIVNLRQLIRIVNDFIISYDVMENLVNPIDYLSIIYIRYYVPDLYELIKNNPKIFISTDTGYVEDNNFSYLPKKYTDKKKAYLDKYFSENNVFFSYRNLISGIFPAVFNEYYSPSPKESEIYNINRRACSGKHFNSYFTERHTGFGELNLKIEEIFKLFRKKEITESYDKLFASYQQNQQAYILENIESCFHAIGINMLEYHIEYFFNNYKYFDSNAGFLMLSAKSRCAVLLSEMLLKADENTCAVILDNLSKRVENIVVLSAVNYWLNDKIKKGSSDSVSNLHFKIRQSINNLKDRVFAENISVYNRQNYLHSITWRLIEEKTDNTQFQIYLNNVLLGESIYALLTDFISISYSSETRISISLKSINDLDLSSIIDKQLITNPPHSDKMKMIEKLYRLSVVERKDDFDDESNSIKVSDIPDWVYDYYGTTKNHFLKSEERRRRSR